MKTLEMVLQRASMLGMAILVLLAIATTILACIDEGFEGPKLLLIDTLKMIWVYRYILLLFFIISAGMNRVCKNHPDTTQAIMRGKYGVIPMTLLASIMPGPAGALQLKEEWSKPDSDKRMVIICLVAMSFCSINAVIFRAKFLGEGLTTIWLCMSIAILLQTWVILKMIPKTWWP